MRQLKHLVGALLFLVLFAGSFSMKVQAAESERATDIQSGTCGENVVWQLVGDTLTISGSGEMDDFVGNAETPWMGGLRLKKVVIQDGVTSIGDYAFNGCSNIEEIEIFASIKRIGKYAFQFSGITDEAFAKLLKGTTHIENGAFSCCPNLTNIVIPKEVTIIGEHAFYDTEISVIRGYANSVAEEYANSNHITFIALDDEGDIVTIGGVVTSYGDASNQIVISAQGSGGAVETAVVGNDEGYELKDVSAGTYTISVSKEHHVPRTYTVTVNDANVTQNMEIYLIGDVTGDGTINARDKKLVYNHIAGTSMLTDYIFAVGDVTGDGVINARDKKLIYNHIAGTSSLWK